ncbi:MAG: anaerobic glycerol-3-phosphate dehydrogenase subunit C [Desulfobacteraceae bacterium]|nr:anaerobic glycerol-3-phosphate dehydrogenase subunit C [Desulfobacteraceae bacterium]MBC2749194.1 anaerobic glycerol-3-phosphate dehydrogenase subunit C [Desulfobacteraceae bacterium]
MTHPDRSTLDLTALQQTLEGDVHSDALHRAMLATDGSIFSVRPAGVVYPRSTEDVRHTARFAARNNLSLHPRGAGSGLCGSALGRGLVVDFTKYMNRLVRLDAAARTFTCQPGYRFGELASLLKGEGLFFPPDPSSGEYATFGGMLATNASGAHSVKYGNTADYLEDAEMVMVDGTVIRLSEVMACSRAALPENFQRLAALYEANAARIRTAYPDTPYNSAGYNLRGLVRDGRLDLRRLLAGAEGTLGIVTEITFRLKDRPNYDSLVVAFMDDIVASARAVQRILPMNPSGIEVMDRSLLKLACENNPALGKAIPADVDNVLLIEFDGFQKEDCSRQAEKVRDLLRSEGFTGQAYTAVTAEEKERFWTVRKAAVPILYKMKGRRKILALVEDAAVPIRNLVPFFEGIYRVLEHRGVTFVIYGHIAKGLLHTRPLLDLKDSRDVDLLRTIADDYYAMVRDLDGTVSGEHGDGRLRSAYIKRRYPDIYPLFLETKALLDPDHRLNPDIITHHEPDQMACDLRYGSAYRSRDPENQRLNWRDGFIEAIEKCHGCSQCTTVTTATRMCPVFKFTREEAAAPKAKANVLRALISGAIEDKALYTEAFQAVMRHCVNCGSCRHECPSNVNIPQMAIEARTRYADKFGAPLTDHLLANVELAGRFTHPVSPHMKPLMALAPMRTLMEKATGISARRRFVAFDPRPLAARVNPQRRSSGLRVIYFAGCYAGYIRPEIGTAAIRVLEHLGLAVSLPTQHCCGLPLLSKGMARAARSKIHANLRQWGEQVAAADAVVVTCSSCGYALQTEWAAMVDPAEVAAVQAKTVHISRLVNRFRDHLQTAGPPLQLAYHAPCHLRIQPDPNASVDLLAGLDGIHIQPLATHCCGMAGSWGMTADHFDLSRAIGDDLIGQLNRSGADYGVTDCPTCRLQMEEFTGLPIRHPVEIVAARLIKKSRA